MQRANSFSYAQLKPVNSARASSRTIESEILSEGAGNKHLHSASDRHSHSGCVSVYVSCCESAAARLLILLYSV
jgi:hypothetical protein